MSESVLIVDNVSKKFCRNLKKSMLYAMSDLTRSTLGMKSVKDTLRVSEFWALKNISFELKRGDSLALMGVNGSGKTTLLRLIAGLYPPDKGRIKVRGSVASLIAVGAGFHPHMTGRENIYLNASILGLSKDFVGKNFDWIVDFAEIGDFLDAPVATYSSGMRVRLGFAVASVSEPDLLLLDEILAVGDRQFRAKCYNRIAELQKNSAIIFVSHSTQQLLRVCNKGILLDKSEELCLGSLDLAISEYNKIAKPENYSFSQSASEINFLKSKLNNQKLKWGDGLSGQIEIESKENFSDSFIRLVFYNEESVGVAEYQSKKSDIYYDIKKGVNLLEFSVSQVNLADGNYSITVVISQGEGTGLGYLLLLHSHFSIEVNSSFHGNTAVQFR